MLTRVLISLMILLPAATAAQQKTMRSAVEQWLESSGVDSPLSIKVAERQLRGNGELVITRASVAGKSLLLWLRCRPRAQCGEVIATADYLSAHDAHKAYERLATRSQSPEKLRPVVRAGDLVKLVVQRRNVKLELQVKALGCGAVAQLIRVRDPKTKKIYEATVTGPKEVRSSL